MEPFPAYKRRIYFALSVLLFLVLLPAIILYADGWRFKPGFGLVRTGGIYIAVPYPDASVSLNGETVGHSGFLQRNFYIDDLAPAAYVVRVDREDYRSWGRILVVEPQLVTDARAILLPQEISLTQLVVIGTATTTKLIPRTTYNAYFAAFATSTVASTTLPVDESDGVGLFIVKGELLARWMRTDGRPPSIFCGSPTLCDDEISVKRGGGDALDARFFSGGVVYRTKEGGIYFTEADIRPTPVSAQIFSAPGTDMRLINGTLVLKVGDLLYQVEGL